MIFNQITNQRKYVKACNFSNLITTLSSESSNTTTKTWKATKDCWLIGGCGGSAGSGDGSLYINNVLVVASNEGVAGSHGDRSFSLYVPKGTVVGMVRKVRIKVFGCLS